MSDVTVAAFARNRDFLARLIDALAAEALSVLFLETENDAKFQHFRREAWDIAENIGCDFPDMRDPPVSFGAGSELTEAFRYGQERHAHEKEEEADYQSMKARESLIASVLSGEATWEVLALPSPAELLKTLIKASSVSVDGYRLFFEDGVVWYTSPYGQDGILGSEPNDEMLSVFLVDLARGKEYGLVPH